MANQCTNFEVSSLSHSRDIVGGLKMWTLYSTIIETMRLSCTSFEL